MRRIDNSEMRRDDKLQQREARARNECAEPIRMVRVKSAAGPVDIEYAWVNDEGIDRPLIVFLHEGLGSLAIWDEWPRRLCAAAKCRGLIFSRYGYGYSSPRADGPW